MLHGLHFRRWLRWSCSALGLVLATLADGLDARRVRDLTLLDDTGMALARQTPAGERVRYTLAGVIAKLPRGEAVRMEARCDDAHYAGQILHGL